MFNGNATVTARKALGGNYLQSRNTARAMFNKPAVPAAIDLFRSQRIRGLKITRGGEQTTRKYAMSLQRSDGTPEIDGALPMNISSRKDFDYWLEESFRLIDKGTKIHSQAIDCLTASSNAGDRMWEKYMQLGSKAKQYSGRGYLLRSRSCSLAGEKEIAESSLKHFLGSGFNTRIGKKEPGRDNPPGKDDQT